LCFSGQQRKRTVVGHCARRAGLVAGLVAGPRLPAASIRRPGCAGFAVRCLELSVLQSLAVVSLARSDGVLVEFRVQVDHAVLPAQNKERQRLHSDRISSIYRACAAALS